MVCMLWVYLMEKQMLSFTPHVYDERHPRKIWGKLASSLLLVHGVGHDKCIWFPLFSLCYFNHDKDRSTQCTHKQSHTMDGIAIGHSPTSNAMLVYNPGRKTHYEPYLYRLNPYWLPSLIYPQLQNDSNLFCYLLQDKNPAMEEPYSPGTLSNAWIQTPIHFLRGLSWTYLSLWILQALHSTKLFSITACRL